MERTETQLEPDYTDGTWVSVSWKRKAEALEQENALLSARILELERKQVRYC